MCIRDRPQCPPRHHLLEGQGGSPQPQSVWSPGKPASEHLNLLGNNRASTGLVDMSAFIDRALPISSTVHSHRCLFLQLTCVLSKNSASPSQPLRTSVQAATACRTPTPVLPATSLALQPDTSCTLRSPSLLSDRDLPIPPSLPSPRRTEAAPSIPPSFPPLWRCGAESSVPPDGKTTLPHSRHIMTWACEAGGSFCFEDSSIRPDCTWVYFSTSLSGRAIR